MVQNFVLSLSMLRIIDFSQLSSNTEYFLSHFLVNFLTVSNDDVFAACVARIGSDADKMDVRDGLMVFLKTYLKPRVEDKPALKDRVKKMIKYLDRLGSMAFEE